MYISRESTELNKIGCGTVELSLVVLFVRDLHQKKTLQKPTDV